MSSSNSAPPPLPHEDPQIQFGKEMYFPNFTNPQGFSGELRINNGVVNNPSPMYQPRSNFADPMMPQGIDLSTFDREPMYDLINVGLRQGNDTAYVLTDPVQTQPPMWSYGEDRYFSNQMGSEPSLPRDNNMLLVGNNLLQNSIFMNR